MRILLICIVLGFGQVQLFGQSGFYNTKTVEIKTPYSEISGLGKYRHDSISYKKAQTQQEYIYEKFNYRSDGFEVEGYSCRPKNVGKDKVPVIIFNRGGTGNYGKLTEEDLPDFYWLASHGFAVYGSNYRFVGELGKVDQSGGDDVHDVIQLYELVEELDFIDRNNMFMMGVSRGGMMTYQSLKWIDVNAAAIIGGVADLHIQAANRPIFITGWTDLEDPYNYDGLEKILPNFSEKKEEYFDQRSATKWADEINSPVFILHSRQDGFVSADQAMNMALQLHTFGREYKLKIYDKKSHGLPYTEFDSFDEIVSWFKSHMK